jgi:hypothetical protein
VDGEPEKAEQVDTIVKDISDIQARPGIRSLNSNFKIQSDYSAKYLMHKFPKLHQLIIKEHSGLEVHTESARLSNNIMMDLFKFITTVPLVAEVEKIYVEMLTTFQFHLSDFQISKVGSTYLFQ